VADNLLFMKRVARQSSRVKKRFPSSDAMAGAMKIIIMAAAVSSALFLIGSGTAKAETGDQARLGAVENVVLLPWGVRLPARIDTGASTSSLDARNIRVKGKTVEFKLAAEYGGLKIRLPFVRWATVRTAQTAQQRPVVMIELCIGSKRLRTEVNLNDRSAVDYPLLVGRNTIQHNFVVDCSTEYCTQPSCPGVLAQ